MLMFSSLRQLPFVILVEIIPLSPLTSHHHSLVFVHFKLHLIEAVCREQPMGPRRDMQMQSKKHTSLEIYEQMMQT
ncbi:hypothetical protein F8388_010632 [Cannabis sativa]|uniref:Uncharacterized protein n=1 Tax=Cannabis sativa TaxID=3483 RepID=A0A7J6FF35_CANSA|nr:hypothetical protein G4B88_026980 [Cannabis sativa]KAF4368390.1 hypothetical protein F8388_019107 [Cannabis sativa]KAF4368717.1 hypothetical protein G4B88_000974 [Cannabis sativa]KAF4378193.1 hypothetical protein F8388_010632 [Cannabis sativa]